LDASAVTTVYEFEPTEIGVYTFTAPEGSVIGNWGSFSGNLNDPGNETNSCEWTCTAVGQSAYIGVSGVEGEFTLTVTKTAEVEQQQTEYVEYQNLHTPDSSFIQLSGNETMVNVDISKEHSAVLGSDGYYHLDSADGPVLYVQFDGTVNLLEATGGAYGATVMRGSVQKENQTFHYDFLTGIKAYAAVATGGYYPLTDDLITFLMGYGTAQGWYKAALSPFESVKSGNFNEKSAWMAMCVYAEPTE